MSIFVTKLEWILAICSSKRNPEQALKPFLKKTIFMDASVVIGIDVGGTSTKLALVDAEGRILGRSSFDTQARRGGSNFVAAICETAEALYQTVSATHHLLGIGIGTPSCDEVNGTITGAANMPFTETVPLRQLVEDHFNLSTQLVKDANSSALGEMQYGGAKGMSNFILLTLGTGLGSGLVINGRTISGVHGLASELGHISADRNGRYCNCGQRGCLETYVSAPGIKRTVFELMANHTQPSVLRDASFNSMTASDITAAAKAGDAIAQEAFRITGDILGYKIADMVLHLDPQAIFLAGGLAQAGDLILIPANESLKKNLMVMFQNKVTIQLSALGSEDAALLGAASLIWNLQPSVSKTNP
jgi:glucokinase